MNLIINKFAIKHRLTYITERENNVHEFSGSVFLTTDEIKKDLDLDLPVGIIELYHEESRDGYVEDFETWLLKHYPVHQSDNKKAM